MIHRIMFTLNELHHAAIRVVQRVGIVLLLLYLNIQRKRRFITSVIRIIVFNCTYISPTTDFIGDRKFRMWRHRHEPFHCWLTHDQQLLYVCRFFDVQFSIFSTTLICFYRTWFEINVEHRLTSGNIAMAKEIAQRKKYILRADTYEWPVFDDDHDDDVTMKDERGFTLQLTVIFRDFQT